MEALAVVRVVSSENHGDDAMVDFELVGIAEKGGDGVRGSEFGEEEEERNRGE